MTEGQDTGPHDSDRPRPPSPATMPGRPPTPDAMPSRAPSVETAEAPTGDDPAGSRAVEDLREAASALDELDRTDDPGEHADRFEAVHDALVAVLADVDRT